MCSGNVAYQSSHLLDVNDPHSLVIQVMVVASFLICYCNKRECYPKLVYKISYNMFVNKVNYNFNKYSHNLISYTSDLD